MLAAAIQIVAEPAASPEGAGLPHFPSSKYLGL
jgi:hypothetical protein